MQFIDHVIFETFIILFSFIIILLYIKFFEKKVVDLRNYYDKGCFKIKLSLVSIYFNAIKYIYTSSIFPKEAKKQLFILAPLSTLFFSLIGWLIVPYNNNEFLSNLNLGIFYLLTIFSFSIFELLLVGWASGFKYAFLSALNSASQKMLYQLCVGFLIISILINVGSLNLIDIVNAQNRLWFSIKLFPIFILFLICVLTEIKRLPNEILDNENWIFFESKEYIKISNWLFCFTEYSHILLMSILIVIIFLGGWHPIFDIYPLNKINGSIWFLVKFVVVVYAFLWIRAYTPKYKYNQIMDLNLKIFIPISILSMLVSATISIFFYDGTKIV